MMQSLLQMANTTPPCCTPLALLRVAGPYLGKRDARGLVCTSTASARFFSRSRATSLRYFAGIPRNSPSQEQVARSPLLETQGSTTGSIFFGTVQHFHASCYHQSATSGLQSTRNSLDISAVLTTTALRPYSSDSSRTNVRNLARQHSRAYSTAEDPKMYTASFAFFEAIWEAGVTHCFVNLGSDHPSIIEAMVKGQREKNGEFPRIITCPNEV